MSYNPVNWVNGETPINDTNLNNMDNGIAEAHEILADHDKKIDDFVKGQIPEEYVKGAVDDYISENQAGLASKEVVEEVAEEVGRLSSEIGDLEDIDGFYYYSVSNRIDNVEKALVEGVKNCYFEFEYGSIDDNNAYVEGKSRLRTVKKYDLKADRVLHIANGYKIRIIRFDKETGEFVDVVGWRTGDLAIKNVYDYKFVLARDDNSDMDISEGVNLYFEKILSKLPNTGETWAFLGDSITEGINTSKTYHDFIREKAGITNLNYGANGSCISTYILPEESHYYCMCERVATVDKTANKLFIFGGTNDFNRGCPLGEFFTVSEDGTRTFSNDTNTFKGALSVLFQYVKNNFVDSDIVILTPIHRGNFDSQPTDLEKNVGGLYLEDYVNAIKEACALFGIGKVIDLYTLSGMNPNFTTDATKYFHVGTDELHPNEKGHEKIADCILNNM